MNMGRVDDARSDVDGSHGDALPLECGKLIDVSTPRSWGCQQDWMGRDRRGDDCEVVVVVAERDLLLQHAGRGELTIIRC